MPGDYPENNIPREVAEANGSCKVRETIAAYEKVLIGLG
jgi:hypothetical protein